ncbi:unnamed protein product [Boreogadus saida]
MGVSLEYPVEECGSGSVLHVHSSLVVGVDGRARWARCRRGLRVRLQEEAGRGVEELRLQEEAGRGVDGDSESDYRRRLGGVQRGTQSQTTGGGWARCRGAQTTGGGWAGCRGGLRVRLLEEAGRGVEGDSESDYRRRLGEAGQGASDLPHATVVSDRGMHLLLTENVVSGQLLLQNLFARARQVSAYRQRGLSAASPEPQVDTGA